MKLGKKTILAMATTLCIASPLWAQTSVEDIVKSMTAQGYANIEITTTWLGRTKVRAIAQGIKREVVLTRSGQVLRDRTDGNNTEFAYGIGFDTQDGTTNSTAGLATTTSGTGTGDQTNGDISSASGSTGTSSGNGQTDDSSGEEGHEPGDEGPTDGDDGDDSTGDPGGDTNMGELDGGFTTGDGTSGSGPDGTPDNGVTSSN